MPANVWAFAAIAVPFVATPGASTAVVLRNSIAGGVRSGVATALGVNTASIGYGVLTAFGMSAALHRWPDVWLGLRVGGIGYLAWLGVRSLWRALARRHVDAGGWPGAPASAGESTPLARHAREGLLTNTLNPSIATFYLLILPQFIPRTAPFAAGAMLLTAIHVSLALSWHLTWAVAGGSLAAVLGRSRPRRMLEAVTGLALIALAIRLAGT